MHSIRFDSSRCEGKRACLRACPTEAIRIIKGKAVMLTDRCIDCGICITACPSNAIVPLTNSFVEFSRFRHNIAIPSPVFYTQFGKGVNPKLLLEALLEVGFDSYYDVSRICEATTFAAEEYIKNYSGPFPLITPFCPTVVRLVQIRFPDIAGQMLPIDSPMEIAAREAKAKVAAETGLNPEEIGAIYLTPCPVKMVCIRHSPRKLKSQLDGAIAISDIHGPVNTALRRLAADHDDATDEEQTISGIGVGWSRLDGLTRGIKAEALVVSSIEFLIRTFEEIEAGQLKDIQLVECHACRIGCAGGTLNVENPYVSRHRLREIQAKLGREPILDRDEVVERFNLGYYSVDRKLTTEPIKPLDTDLSRAIEKMNMRDELLARLPGINCGVCGAPSCKAFAEDVVLGRAELNSCFAIQREELEKLLEQSIKLMKNNPVGA